MSFFQKMFWFTNSKRIGIYIDYSNIYHAKYTLWRSYNIDKFLQNFVDNKTITKVWFYGAYNKTNITQYQRTQSLQKTFQLPKFYFYFKKLETRWEKQKWNVDTEMWRDIAKNSKLRDTLVLFSGDGDFLYIIDQLIKKENKQIVIVSTRWHIAKELINYINTHDINTCRFIDIHQENEIALPIKKALKHERRWVCMPPELVKYIESVDEEKRQKLYDWMQSVCDNKKDNLLLPVDFDTLSNNNHYPTIKTILHRKEEEKKQLLEYIKSTL